MPQEALDNSLIKDSKKLTERKRYIAYDYVKENAIDYATFWHDEKTIDEINIYRATEDAMHKVLDKLIVKPEHILVDGTHFPVYMKNNMVIPHTCIPKGDNLYNSIAAASILAKVERDKYILELCDKYPDLDEKYNLKSNKGYGAKVHMDGIKKHGITEWHRKSFGICKMY